MRLSREAILAEIQNAEQERVRMYEVIDSVMDAEDHHPLHKSTVDSAFANIDKLDKRIAELNAKLT